MQQTFTLIFLFLLQTAMAQIAVDYHRSPLKGKVKKVMVKNYDGDGQLAAEEPFFSYWAEYDTFGNDTHILQFLHYSGTPEPIGRVKKEYTGGRLHEIRIFDIKKGKTETLKKRITTTYEHGKLLHEQHFTGTPKKLTATVEYLDTQEKKGVSSGKFIKREESDGLWTESKGAFSKDSIGILFYVLLDSKGDTLTSIRQLYHNKTGYSYLEKMNTEYGVTATRTTATLSFDKQGNVSKIKEERKDLLSDKVSVYYTVLKYQYEGEPELAAPYAAPQDVISLLTDGSFWRNDEYQLLLQFQKTGKNQGTWHSQFLGEKPSAEHWLGGLQKNETGTWRYQDIAYSKLFNIYAGKMATSLNPPKVSDNTLLLETSGRKPERVSFIRTASGFTTPSFSEIEEDVAAEPIPEKAIPASGAADEVLSLVDEPAEFIGGQKAMQDHISKHLKYPKNALNGTVIVRFVVRKDGSVDEPTILRSMGIVYDEEVLRVVRSFPNFKAAKHKGQEVDMYFTLPVRFSI